MTLIGKTIVVTGVASGIGARVGELAVALGRRRHRGRRQDAGRVDCTPSFSADIASPQVDRGNRAGPAAARRCALQRRRRLRAGRRDHDARDQFLRLARADGSDCARIREGGAVVNVASIAGYGWRANLERAKAIRRSPRLSRHRRAPRGAYVPEAEAYPVSKELLLLWTMQAAHQPLFKDRGMRVNAVSPGPVSTPISQGVPPDFWRCRASTTTSRAWARRNRAGYRARRAVPLFGRGAMDQRRKHSGRRRSRGLGQRDRSRVLTTRTRRRRALGLISGRNR